MRYAVIIYTDTTSEAAIADYMQQRRWDRQRERRRRQRRQYFPKQRLTGVFLLVFTVLAVMATGGDATIAIITVPLGLYLLFTKEMLLVNDFTGKRKRGSDNGKRTDRGRSRRIRI
jgi:hypothetical protein